MKHLLFVHKSFSRFVEADLKLLSSRYSVDEWFQRGRGVNVWRLWRAVLATDIVFGWFASWHTFIPLLLSRVLGRPSILIVGGYDVSNMPDYGHQAHATKKWIGRATMALATRIMAFSDFSRQEAIENAAVNPGKVVTSYLAVTNVDYRRRRKELLVVTAANVNESNLTRKGLDPFVRAAAATPELHFVVIGDIQEAAAAEHLRLIATANVKLTGKVTDDELVDLFSRATVYVQPSLHEGFGLAVAEAMLCECVPVITRAGSLPEVVADTGIYLDSVKPSVIASAIRRAVREQAILGPRARDRVRREFPPERRARDLYTTVEALTAPHQSASGGR